nr:oligosaccharide flippase family protein [uncultured Devosia sp.]
MIQNVGALTLVQIANYIAPLLTLPYLTRVLGPEAFGTVAFAQILMLWLVILVNYGFPWSATRDIAARRDDPEYVARQFSANWTAQWLLTLLAGVVLVLVVTMVPAVRKDATLYLSGYTIVLGTALFPIWLMQGLERLREVAVLQVVGRFALLALVFILVRGPEDAALAVIAQGSGGIVAGLLCLWWIKRKRLVHYALPTRKEILAAAREGGKIFISQVAISFYTAFIPTALGMVSGTVPVGQYMIADRARSAAQSFMGPISQALFPRMSFLFGTNDLGNARRMLKISLIATFVVSGAASIALFVLADWIVMLLGGQEFLFAAQILRWLSPVPFCVGLSNLFGLQIMLPRRKTRAFNTILISAAVLGTALIFPMANWRGAEGAAMTVLAVEMWVTLTMAAYLAKNGLTDEKASE